MSAFVSVFDHGLLYGDGVFEDMRFYGGKAWSPRGRRLRTGIRSHRGSSRSII
ncbi:MAG TPA: hypothetical protein VFM14_00670 [Gemmatimonadales bacterium]|nr:hypothetical protein [Gemmatimonadales bacterium]